ncbi:MAG: guanylate kinase, partial [Deltaproteobacteria bacterium]
ETNGKYYWFVDDAAFDRMLSDGEFLECADVFGKRYGTSKKDLDTLLKAGSDVLLEIDVQGALNLRKTLNKGAYIFILPPSIKVCEDRLKSRSSEEPEEIQRRLKIAVEEIKRAVDYDYVIVNNDLEAAFERLKAVMIAEKARTVNMSGAVEGLLADVR